MNDPKSDAIELLSGLSRRPVRPEEVTPPIAFLSALCAASLGVIYADGQIAVAEEQLLETMLDALMPERDPETRALLDAIIEGFISSPIYQTPSGWLPLALALQPSERLLLLSLGYEMAATDGEIAASENQQLQEIARALEIDSRYVETIAEIAIGSALPDPESYREVRALLDPQGFRHLDIRLVDFETVELLTRLSDYTFSQVNTPPVAVFLGALAVLALEIMGADGQVTLVEQTLVAEALANLLPSESAQPNLRSAMLGMVGRLQASPEICSPSDWLKLTRSLAYSERLLLLAFAYDLAAVDGIAPAERESLAAVAESLAIAPEALRLFDAAFAGEAVTPQAVWHQLLAAFHPDGFAHLEPAIVTAARTMHDKLEVLAR